MIPTIGDAGTTITVTRPDQDTDPTDGSAPTTAASGIRAMITDAYGSRTMIGGQRVLYDFKLNCDPADVRPGDLIRDERLDLDYRVVWSVFRPGLGLDHIEGGLLRAVGAQ